MELTESMFRYLAEKVCGSTKISYNGVEIDLGKPFATNDNDTTPSRNTQVLTSTRLPDDAAAKKLADEHHIAVRRASQKR